MGEDTATHLHKFEQTLETVEDRGDWHAIVHGVEKSRTQLSD